VPLAIERVMLYWFPLVQDVVRKTQMDLPAAQVKEVAPVPVAVTDTFVRKLT